VILCDAGGLGPMVTGAELDHLRACNFARRALTMPIQKEAILGQIRRYDPTDAAEVSRRIRATAGVDRAVERIMGLYEEVISEYRTAACRPSAEEESRAAGAYLLWLNPFLKAWRLLHRQREASRLQLERLRTEVAQRDGTIRALVGLLEEERRLRHGSPTTGQ
jgi:hypothetical protein